MANDLLDFIGALYSNMDETPGQGIGGRIQGAVCKYCWINQADREVMGHPTCRRCAKEADTTYSIAMGWGHEGDISFGLGSKEQTEYQLRQEKDWNTAQKGKYPSEKPSSDEDSI